MSRLRTVSVCFTDLHELAKAGHSGFSRAKNGKVYFNLSIWDKKEPDQFGKNVSVILNTSKEKKDIDPSPFVGGGWISEYQENSTTNSPDSPLVAEGEDDLPF